MRLATAGSHVRDRGHRRPRTLLVAALGLALLVPGVAPLAVGAEAPAPGTGGEVQQVQTVAPAATAATTTTPTTPTTPAVQAVAVAGVPGVCDTNNKSGSLDSFMQRSDVTDWKQGKLSEGLYEGGYVHQRVMLSKLAAGENELVLTYDVRKGGTWAYDSIDRYSFERSTITRWHVVEGTGPDRVDTVHVTFDVPAGRSTDTLYFSAHIASEIDHGPGSGAGSISGSPYHVAMSTLNCHPTGNMDNQISAQDVQAGHVTVIKDATPADGTDFSFSIDGADTTSFLLDDGADADTYGDRVTYRVAPGTWTVSELDLPAGWRLAGTACTGATATYGGTSATFTVVDDGRVTCTFTNGKIQRRDLTVSTTALPSYDRDYDWTVEKVVPSADRQEVPAGTGAQFTYDVTVTPSAPRDSAFAVTGAITVANPNDVPVSGVDVFSGFLGSACSVPGGNAVTIDAGSRVVLAYRCAVPTGTPSTVGTHTARATWDAAAYPGTSGSAQGAAPVDFAGATVRTTDGSVRVTDSAVDLTGYDDGTQKGDLVSAGDGVARFTYDVTWPGVPGRCTTYDNTASIAAPESAGAAGTGVVASSTESVEVCAGADLGVATTAEAALVRTFGWTLDKSATETEVDVDATTGTAMAHYAVEVAPDDYTDSAWALAGTVAVTNPNDWQDVVTTVSAATTLDGGATCTVDGADARPGEPGLQVLVPRSAAVTLDYSCTLTGRPAYSGASTGTASWDAAAFSTPTGSAGHFAPIAEDDWTVTEVDATVTVRDDRTDPAHPVTLGTARWADGARTYRYALPLEGVRGECDVRHTNRAWIPETGDEDSVTVTVCWPTPAIDVVKTAWDAPSAAQLDGATELRDGAAVPRGTAVTWTYEVTNTGTSELTGIDLVDRYDDAGTTGTVAVTCPSATLAPGASMTCTGSARIGAGTYGPGAP